MRNLSTESPHTSWQKYISKVLLNKINSINVKYYISLLCLILICSCAQKTSFENIKGTCKLYLYSDSTYKFTFPTFFEKKTEAGKFKLMNNNLTLIRKKLNDIDSVDISYTCWKDNPDSLLITFSDLYKNAINPKLFINYSKTYFTTDTFGHIELSYKDLERKSIIEPNEKIKSFRMVYNGKNYLQNMFYYKDSRKPDRLDFRLNQFIGEKYAMLKREYLMRNDTIYLNDMERKSIGSDDKLFKR